MQNFLDHLKKNKTVLLPPLLSLLATYGISKLFEFEISSINLMNSFATVLIFFLFLFLFQKIITIKKPATIFSAIFSLLLGCALIIGSQLDSTSNIAWEWQTFLSIFCLTIALFPLFIYFASWIQKYKLPINQKLNNPKKTFWISFLLIFIGGTLIWLAFFPGHYGYDAPYQIMQFSNDNNRITSHFSILYSFILSETVYFGEYLFGNVSAGFALFCFLQMTLMSFISAYISTFINQKTKNFYFWIGTVLFFSLFPLYTMLSISAAQDVLFGGIFALIFMELLKFSEQKELYWYQKRIFFILPILILLLCLLRNNGIYIILFSFVITICVMKGQRRKLLPLFSIPILLFFIYSGPLMTLFNVNKNDTINEMSSIPTQQIARVYSYNKSALSEDELTRINFYYPAENSFKNYPDNPSISDLQKNSLDANAIKTSPLDYLSLWLKLGIKDPQNYIEAFLLNTLGFWHLNKEYPDSRIYHPFIETKNINAKEYNENYEDIPDDTKLPIYQKIVNASIGSPNGYKYIPVFSTLFSGALYFWIFSILLGVCLYRKKWNLLMPLSLPFGLYITLFLSPVAICRYIYPIIIITPIMIMLFFNIPKNKIPETSK